MIKKLYNIKKEIKMLTVLYSFKSQEWREILEI